MFLDFLIRFRESTLERKEESERDRAKLARTASVNVKRNRQWRQHFMNLVGLISTAVLSLTLVAAAPAYAQEQHEQNEDKAKPAQEEKKAEPAKKAEQEKSAKQEEKGAVQQQEKSNKQEEKTAQEQHAQQAKPEQHMEHAAAGRIPAERYKANFGREHTFRVSQAEYSGGRRFQYGGYWFGFVDAWPGNW